MNKQYVTLEVKALDDDSEHGSFEAILSVPKVDRDNEVIDAYAFRPLPKSIPIFGDHVATIATTVARGQPKYDSDGTLRVKGQYDGDDYSQLVRSKVRSGSVANMSVGFMPRNRSKSPGVKGKDGATHYPAGSLELLESSFVPIPSLREATVTMAKSLTDDLAEAAHLNDATPEIGCGQTFTVAGTPVRIESRTWDSKTQTATIRGRAIDAETEIPDPEDRIAKAAEASELLTQLADVVLESMDSGEADQVVLNLETLQGAFPQE